jgi:hypothetical protein
MHRILTRGRSRLFTLPPKIRGIRGVLGHLILAFQIRACLTSTRGYRRMLYPGTRRTFGSIPISQLDFHMILTTSMIDLVEIPETYYSCDLRSSFLILSLDFSKLFCVIRVNMTSF